MSETTRDLLWDAEEEPLGSQLIVHGEAFAVAGIVGDVHHFGPNQPTWPMVYLPAEQEPWNGITRGLSLVVWTQGPPEQYEPQIRAAIASVDGAIPVGPMETMGDLLAARVTAPRFRLAFMGGFGVMALLITLVGLGGVLTFSVNRRRREMGVRLALGAAPKSIGALVVAEALRLLAIGLAIGVAVAVPVATQVSRFLFEVEPWDPESFAAVSTILLFGTACASLIPAVKAAQADPVEALRAE